MPWAQEAQERSRAGIALMPWAQEAQEQSPADLVYWQ